MKGDLHTSGKPLAPFKTIQIQLYLKNIFAVIQDLTVAKQDAVQQITTMVGLHIQHSPHSRNLTKVQFSLKNVVFHLFCNIYYLFHFH